MQTTGFLSRNDAANARAIPGALFHFLANGAQTGGAYSLMYIEVHKGNEPPPHTHQREDESYYILEGAIRFWIGDRVVDARAGDFVHLPKGVPHRFELQTECVKELMWIAPAGLETWFWDNSAPAPDGRPLPLPTAPPAPEMIARFVQTLSEYGVEMAPVGVPR
ncbi:quercetin 2,3-dioxygenase [Flaviaesturariibacter amylovorans]|uniref:Cupin type-2 domain-containing protein n=1 Tax=Flaviaesturariibacter amylovorans TaxID=1084520 RepID=A0ABP8HDI7_9BACT